MTVELRIHGVSGAPAEQVLDHPVLVQCAGDRHTGFFRPRIRLSDDGAPSGIIREAYSWGHLTAGAAARALWLLLLPFTLANVAIWMRPTTRPRWLDAVVCGLCRTFCLSLTVLLVLAAAGAVMDVTAWQCGSTSCAQAHWFLASLQNAKPGVLLAVGATGPLAVVVLLWATSRAVWQRYEKYPDGESNQEPPRVVSALAAPVLAEPGFWHGKHLVDRLRSVHISVALATCAALISFPAVHFDSGAGSGWQWIGWTVFVAALVTVLFGVVALWMAPVVDRDARSTRWTPTLRYARWIGVLTVLAALGYALVPRSAWRSVGPLPGYHWSVKSLVLVQIGLITALLLSVALGRLIVRPLTGNRATFAGVGDRFAGNCDTGSDTLRATLAPVKPAFAGFATLICSVLAFVLGMAFSAGVVFRVADYLDPTHNLVEPDSPLRPASAFVWSAFTAPFVLISAILAVVFAAVSVMPRLSRRARTIVRADFSDELPRTHLPQRARRLVRVSAYAALTDYAPRLLAVACAPAFLLGVIALAIALIVDVGPTQLASSDTWLASVLSAITVAGAWLIGAFALGLMFVGVQAYRTPRLRRMVGVLWDVGTFWPRAGHPLAPPCYAERAVPELAHRAEWLATGGESGGVVLSGHSQGSVLALATVLQLPDSALAGTALLTYGSPLRRLYARYFPAFLGEDTLGYAAQLLSRVEKKGATRTRQEVRWRNLWRDTDPIGGRTELDDVDVRLRDPVTWDAPPGDLASPPVRGHFDYPADPQFDRILTTLASR